MEDYIRTGALERNLRNRAVQTTQRVIREDLDEAVVTGLLSREEAADVAIQAILDWKKRA